MPGGGGANIPMHCRDANGRKHRLFNPAVRHGEAPEGTDFTLDEWRALLSGLKKERDRRRWFTIFPIALVFIPIVFALASHGLPWYAAFLLGTFPLWALLLLWSGTYFLASRTWGTLAFTNTSEADVIKAMLKRNRCPSCAYRLPYATPDGRATCSECGALWRSRNFRTTPPPLP